MGRKLLQKLQNKMYEIIYIHFIYIQFFIFFYSYTIVNLKLLITFIKRNAQTVREKIENKFLNFICHIDIKVHYK